MIACFQAGTAVHTNQGLMPIENIRVGTQILTQDGPGDAACYRPVWRTVAQLAQAVYAVQILHADAEVSTLFVTPDTPFQIEDASSCAPRPVAANALQPGQTLFLTGGRKAQVKLSAPVLHTQHAQYGFAADANTGIGIVVDLSERQLQLADASIAQTLGRLDSREPVRVPVYHFDVQKFSTCYVGDAGVWVHNMECTTGEAIDFAARKAEREGDRPTCFPADTYVIGRYSQWLEIDHLSVGDWVLSRSEKTGEQAYRRVTKKFEHARESMCAPMTPLYAIDFITPAGEKDGVYATLEHPFWVVGEGWVKACELKPGQLLEICDPIGTDDCNRSAGLKVHDVVMSGGRWQAKVVSVEPSFSVGVVYNIEVEDFHTYFVGSHGVWVHNKNQGEPVFTQELKLSNNDAEAFGNKRQDNPNESIENRNAARGENEAAKELAQHDNLEVVQLPGKNSLGKDGRSNPDLLINARTADIYTPQKPAADLPQLSDPSVLGKKPQNIYDTITKKTIAQSSDIVLNLRFIRLLCG